MRRCLGAVARAFGWIAWVTLPAVAACGQDLQDLTDGPECRPVEPAIALPGYLFETSGVAASILNPALVWTHNDGGRGPFLYALDRDGQLRARIELSRRNRDWEDIARARCELGACLYVANTGDNSERRDNISLYRLAEPEVADELDVNADGNVNTGGNVDADRSVDVERYRMTLPDGPRDIEAMYVLPGEQIFFVTKGRNHPVTVYRYPSPLRSEEIVTLVEVQRLTDGPADVPGMVTGASATLDGGTVAIRTYATLTFFGVTEGEQLLESRVGRVNLRPLREAQGEGVAFGANGEISLTSESVFGSSPSLTFLNCDVG